MGCSVSFFKKLYLRMRRPKRERWIRDDERRLLPNEVEPKKPHYGAIPKRIERQVIEDIVSQDLPRRLPDDKPEWNMYEEIHRQLIGTLFQQTGSSGAAFEDSTADLRREEKRANSMVEKNESERHKSRNVSWLDSSGHLATDDEKMTANARKLAADDEAVTAKSRQLTRNNQKMTAEDRKLTTKYERRAEAGHQLASEQVASSDAVRTDDDVQPMMSPYDAEIARDVQDVMPGGRHHREIEMLFAEYRQEMAQQEDDQDRQDGPNDEDGDDAALYELERYDIVVHSCSSNDASWVNKWFGS